MDTFKSALYYNIGFAFQRNQVILQSSFLQFNYPRAFLPWEPHASFVLENHGKYSTSYLHSQFSAEGKKSDRLYFGKYKNTMRKIPLKYTNF